MNWRGPARRLRRYGPSILRGHANRGWCPICEKPTLFIEVGPWLRAQYLCWRCGSVPRWRALIAILEAERPDWREATIYECSPGGPASAKLGRDCPGYRSSHYWPDVTPGSTRDGVRCENLEALTFPDESFDVVVTQDVFEHILDPEAAFDEIARVLRPDGLHVFTVPVFRGRCTLVRVARDGSMLEPPEYHQNPADPNGSLVIREWGDDLIDTIEQATALHTSSYRPKDRRRGLDGEFLEVFVTRKSP